MQAAVLESIGKHLDALESLLNAIILLAVVVAWAGVRRSRTIEALGTKIDRRHAFFVMSALYLIANMVALVVFLRLGDLVTMLDDAHLAEGVWKLALHPWILNPFSYFGQSIIAQTYSVEGYGLLVVVWWLCNASLSTLMDDKRNKVARALLGLFLAIGVASMLAISRVDLLAGFALGKAGASDPALRDLAHSMSRVIGLRTANTALGAGVGALLFGAANAIQVRWGNTRNVAAQHAAAADERRRNVEVE